MNVIDCRKLDCPTPVLNVKKALEQYREIRVLLDDGAPRENVIRFARNRGYQVTEEPHEHAGWALSIVAAPGEPGQSNPGSNHDKRILLITSDRIGNGSDELGKLLMKNFIHTLLEVEELPTRMIFLNSGVLLTCEGSDVLEALGKLHGTGVEIVSCGLCLDFYSLKDKLRTGSITNMLDTVESLMHAGSVIKL